MEKEIIKPIYECLVCGYEWQLVYYSEYTPDLKRNCPNCGKENNPKK